MPDACCRLGATPWLGAASAVPLTFDELMALQADAAQDLVWSFPFMLPPWLKRWWSTFGAGQESLLWQIRDGGDRLLGVAPLRLEGRTARFMGSLDLCDYQDFIVRRGLEPEFFHALLLILRQRGISGLDLSGLRPDSATLRGLPAAAEIRGCRMAMEQEDISCELTLPSSWEAYLAALSGKERHEIHRKLRRMEQSFPLRLETVESLEDVDAAMDHFLHLFRMSRPEKREFLTEARESFVRGMARSLAEEGLVRLHFLVAGRKRVASALCFDFQNTVYLYNSGHDPDYRDLSAGLLCKVLTLRHGIESGRGTYDFLKGAETYKARLGARPVPLYRCRISLE
jgi:CelD/BcsL family acetyltransferase involved in cellulose biosynthesis